VRYGFSLDDALRELRAWAVGVVEEEQQESDHAIAVQNAQVMGQIDGLLGI
jgi:hypothetical protein